jgi:hypothetical protein
MRKGRNELAKVALKERYILAEHASRAGENFEQYGIAK